MSGRCVLVVDDDESYLSVLKLCMRTCGFGHIFTASDGTEALQRLGDRKIDLVISDWNMEPMDGLALLRAIRFTPTLESVPFILMTANLSEVAWREAIRLNVSEFLVKPFSLTYLRAACYLACPGNAPNERRGEDELPLDDDHRRRPNRVRRLLEAIGLRRAPDLTPRVGG